MGKWTFKFHKVPTGQPSFSCYKSNWSVQGFMQGFKETNKIIVLVTPETKTSLRLKATTGSVEHDDAINIAISSEQCVTLERRISNPFGSDTIKHFFKVTKKQGLNALMLYLLDAFKIMGVAYDETEIHLYFSGTDTMTVDITKDITNWEE